MRMSQMLNRSIPRFRRAEPAFVPVESRSQVRLLNERPPKGC
jgi:hypothetical protein